jgi:hypothetical protein
MVLLDPPLGRHGSRPLPHGIWLPVPPVNTAAPCFDLREAMSLSPDPTKHEKKIRVEVSSHPIATKTIT